MSGEYGLALALAILLYFLPFFIAYNRALANKGSIFILNLLFGWTGIGWIVLLFYSFLSKNSENGNFV
ncbi:MULTISPECIES: superinfection immunity protein [unclassified Rhizobium]|nr:superinfection immunity protein [Rhizobium sp. L58/93]MBO9185592.1 superinfection immunity protein [Rhizobium sp. E27B/91]QXZ82347.1 superinfection immunity protein [Rhizobium sp. K1/93]QXZ90140.1 superinfection immunity protein [Rhizobium sp. K15/93]QYA02680.1 superinfection immunity protein [Rhizobium sp. B21/90]